MTTIPKYFVPTGLFIRKMRNGHTDYVLFLDREGNYSGQNCVRLCQAVKHLNLQIFVLSLQCFTSQSIDFSVFITYVFRRGNRIFMIAFEYDTCLIRTDLFHSKLSPYQYSKDSRDAIWNIHNLCKRVKVYVMTIALNQPGERTGFTIEMAIEQLMTHDNAKNEKLASLYEKVQLENLPVLRRAGNAIYFRKKILLTMSERHYMKILASPTAKVSRESKCWV